jgi:hypothetical protein
MIPSLRLTLVAMLAAPVLAGCGTSSDGSEGGSTSASEPAVSASDLEPTAEWLAGQVGPEGFVRGEYVDHGLTLDYASALAEVGGHDDVADRILDAMQDPNEVSGYVSFYDERKNGQYAGATAKLVSTVVAAGREVEDHRADLVDDLEAMVVTSGPEQGRAKDTGATDYSNTISQSYVVRALSVTERARLADAVGFLLQQQCEEGYFRESMAAGRGGEHTCDDAKKEEGAPSVDATAHAIEALTVARDVVGMDEEGDVAAALDEAADWLTGAQGPDGGFAVDGSQDGEQNANSTGLAAAALTLAGSPEPAAAAADWLLEHRVDEDADGLGDEAGAVAFSEQALAKARRSGIAPGDRPTWQRSTVEALRGLHAVSEE